MDAKKVTLRDVARRAGVSPGTVSRTFTNSARVAPEVRERILEAAKTLGYRPAAAAVGDRIAILVNNLATLTGSYDSTLFSALTRRIAEKGYGIEIEDIQRSDLAFEHFVKAAVSISYAPAMAAKLQSVSQVPLLTVNSVIPGLPAVCVDHAQGARLAVEHLRSRGCRRVAMFTTGSDNWGGLERLRGYREAVPDASQRLFRVVGDAEDLFESVAWILAQGADALVVACEGLALPTCRALELLGKKIPEDLSVISYEDPRQSRYLSPPHSTIDQNLEALAAKTVELLMELAGKPRPEPFQIMLENQLIERESVRC